MDDQLQPVDHGCVLYATVDDQLSAVARYASTGFGSGQRVVYLADTETSSDRIARTLRRKGIKVGDALATGQTLWMLDDSGGRITFAEGPIEADAS